MSSCNAVGSLVPQNTRQTCAWLSSRSTEPGASPFSSGQDRLRSPYTRTFARMRQRIFSRRGAVTRPAAPSAQTSQTQTNGSDTFSPASASKGACIRYSADSGAQYTWSSLPMYSTK